MERLFERIFKHFNFNLHEYNRLVRTSDQFMFRSQPKIHVFVKFFIYFLIFLSSFVFFYMYGVYNNHLNYLYPFERHLADGTIWHGYIPVKDSIASHTWIYILFGIIYLLSTIEFIKLIKGLKAKEKVVRLNDLYSFDYALFCSTLLVATIRLIIYFTLNDVQYFMNPSVYAETLKQNSPMQVEVSQMLLAGFYILTIVTCLLPAIYIIAYIAKPRLTKEMHEQLVITSKEINAADKQKRKDRFSKIKNNKEKDSSEN